MVYLQKILNTDLSYPGFAFPIESWALETYLGVLEEYLPFTQEQYRLRARRELEKEGLPENELGGELADVDDAADRQIPRFFRIGAIIPIWGLFESFVSDIAAYIKRREGINVALRDIRAGSFCEQAEKYFEAIHRIELPWSGSERVALNHLQELRNVIAHRNGRISDQSEDKQKRIAQIVKSVSGVDIQDALLVISAEYIHQAAALVFETVGDLSNEIASRYDGPQMPERGVKQR